jgi:polysaccharide export outer membrane protein
MTSMKLLRKFSRHWFFVGMLLLGGSLFNGCHTSPQPVRPLQAGTNLPVAAPVNSQPLIGAVASIKLRVGDSISINYSDAPTVIPAYEGRVKDDGTITIPPFSQTFDVVGKNVRELEQEIRKRYVPDYFRNLTVAIQTQALYFSVDGEVKTPNRYFYSGQTTVLQAIATANGFTDFAQKKKVRIIRADGKQLIVNCVKILDRPENDVQIYPGDRINVPRRLL